MWLSTFVDFGNVWGPLQDVQASDIRVSAGLGVSWDSPVGPLRFSFSYPLKSESYDKVERFQFQLGSAF